MRLYHGLTLPELGALADVVRERKHPHRAVGVHHHDRNINYTRTCVMRILHVLRVHAWKSVDDDSYILTKEQIGEKIKEPGGD